MTLRSVTSLLMLVAVLAAPGIPGPGGCLDFAQALWSQQLDREGLVGMEDALDAILKASLNLPPAKRAEITSQVEKIRKILDASLTAGLPGVYDEAGFEALVARLQKLARFQDQQVVLQQAALNGSFSMAQIRRILDLVPAQSDQRTAASILVPGSWDPPNLKLLHDIFLTKADRDFLARLAGLASD